MRVHFHWWHKGYIVLYLPQYAYAVLWPYTDNYVNLHTCHTRRTSVSISHVTSAEHAYIQKFTSEYFIKFGLLLAADAQILRWISFNAKCSPYVVPATYLEMVALDAPFNYVFWNQSLFYHFFHNYRNALSKSVTPMPYNPCRISQPFRSFRSALLPANRHIPHFVFNFTRFYPVSFPATCAAFPASHA